MLIFVVRESKDHSKVKENVKEYFFRYIGMSFKRTNRNRSVDLKTKNVGLLGIL